jgi:hypothetical protein
MHAMLMGAAMLALAGPVSQDSVPLYDNLGEHHYRITTAEPIAQRYFDQGLRLYYAFNHAEAIRAFEEGARRDPSCAMCWWGVAVSLGPNINLPMDPELEPVALEAIREAQARAGHVSPVERALIQATARRYGNEAGADRAARDSAYASALSEVVRDHPADLEAATLFAESLMTLRPWSYWTRSGDPEPGTELILRDLERVIAANPDHPGACHFYIHAVEAVHPQWALPCAERLAALMPGAGHLVHMPAHIYIRVGRYADAIRCQRARGACRRDVHPATSGPAWGSMWPGTTRTTTTSWLSRRPWPGRKSMAVEAAEKVAEPSSPWEFLRGPWNDDAPELSRSGPSRCSGAVRETMGRRSWPSTPSRHQEHCCTPAPCGITPGGGPYAALRDFCLGAERRARRALQGSHRSHPALDGLVLEFNEAQRTILEDRPKGCWQASWTQPGDGRTRGSSSTSARQPPRSRTDLVYGEPPEWSIPVRHDLGSRSFSPPGAGSRPKRSSWRISRASRRTDGPSRGWPGR